MPYDPRDPDYFDPKAVEKEMARVAELCNGCRRCYRLCPSFDYMLDEAVDGNDGDVDKITSTDYRKIVDLCWQCKLCYNHCPYTPPHNWDIDFPRLMLRAKAARARAEGVSRQDAWLGNVDAVGTLGSAAAPLSNWANRFAPHRMFMEAVVGIDRSRNLPRFHHKTFARWFRGRERERTRATGSAERRIHSGAPPEGARGGAPQHPPPQDDQRRIHSGAPPEGARGGAPQHPPAQRR